MAKSTKAQAATASDRGSVGPDFFIPIAREVLNFFAFATEAAEAGSKDKFTASAAVLAQPNDFTTHRAVAQLAAVQNERARNLVRVREEPAIARIVARDESDEERTYYICRATPVGAPAGLLAVSYRAPMGRLASLPVGAEEEIRLPRGREYFEVRERATLKPRHNRDGWDSVDSVLHGHHYGPVTIASFAQLLGLQKESSERDIIAELLAGEKQAAMIRDGKRRTIINKMALRDQPILDQFQDEIFRLPIDSRLAVLGPPGSGKTTTLIKRLGLTLDLGSINQYREDGDRRLIEATFAGEAGHAESWIMFTPTELLKQYVKEAFNQEGIAAPDSRIKTWSDYSFELGRGELRALRTGSGGGPFILKPDLPSLQAGIFEHQRDWYGDFDTWQSAQFWRDLEEQAAVLARVGETEMRGAGRRIQAFLSSAGSARSVATLALVADAADSLRGGLSELRKVSDASIRRALSQHARANTRLLDELLEVVLSLKADEAPVEEAEVEDLDDNELPPRVGRELAFEAYVRAVKALARAIAAGRRLRPGSHDSRIVAWLEKRIPTEEELKALGRNLQTEQAARSIINAARRHVFGIPGRYRRFRRERQLEGKWYTPEGFAAGEIGQLELDLIALSTLKAARKLQTDPGFSRHVDNSPFLSPLRQLYRTQIVVDEVTDFSPIQLAGMAALCDPASNSFFVCGDFNQRITRWGSRTIDDLRWVFPDIEIRPIRITYRHSRQLNELARQIAMLSDPSIEEVQLPPATDSDEVKPVLGSNLSDVDTLARWLGDRIVEIERLTQKLPSIAVLVNTEAEVSPVAEALDRVLRDNNVRAVPCPGGRVVGQEMDVRVFDVQHIKGLEFEAVFLVAIDRLAEQERDIFEKYLYVGATRAATYLGITLEGDGLPEKIRHLEPLFDETWS